MSVQPGEVLQKDPSAELVYTWDWTAWLGAASIASFEIVMPTQPDALLTVDNDAILAGSKTVSMRLLGGTLNNKYQVTCRIVTNEAIPQTDDRTVTIWIQNQ